MPKTTSQDSASTERVIKKYPNRRLYDTMTSSYITLAEVKQMVMQSESFVVRDAKTSEDLTRSILLQIILEEEAGGSPMFTTPVLSGMIRFYGHAMQGLMGGYLEKTMQTLMDIKIPGMAGMPAMPTMPTMPTMPMGVMPDVSTMASALGGNAFVQMQEKMQQQMQAQLQEQQEQIKAQLQKQTEQFLAAMGLKR